jgi:hypothetical protein
VPQLLAGHTGAADQGHGYIPVDAGLETIPVSTARVQGFDSLYVFWQGGHPPCAIRVLRRYRKPSLLRGRWTEALI